MNALPKLKLLIIIGVILMMTTTGAEAQSMVERPLTQADIDGYVYITPRLHGPILKDPILAGAVLLDSQLSRKRAVFITSKIAITQAVVMGILSPEQLTKALVPPVMRPSTRELSLVQKNLTSILRAQALAQKASNPSPPQ